MWSNSTTCFYDERYIGFPILVQWSRNANDYRFGISNPTHLCGGQKSLSLQDSSYRVRGNMLDITLAGIELPDLRFVYIKAHHSGSGACELDRQRQTDITEPDNANLHTSTRVP